MAKSLHGSRQPAGSSIDLIMLATVTTDDYAWLGTRSWGEYCSRHGYSFNVTREQLVPDMHPVWSKIEMTRRHLRETDASHVVMVDADSAVYNPEKALSDLVTIGKPLKFASDTAFPRAGWWFRRLPLKIKTGRLVLPNAGFIVTENNPYTHAFFDEWMSLARGRYAGLADTHPRNQNVLWHGMLRRHSRNIATLGDTVIRITNHKHLQLLRNYDPLALHFKHETVSAETVAGFIKRNEADGTRA